MRGILGLSPGHRPGDPSRVARVHRPTTTATLLVMAAVSALTGCVTVQRTPEPGHAAATARPPGTRPDGAAAPAAQASPRQALERTDPSAAGDPAGRTPSRPTAGAEAGAPAGTARPAAPAPRSHERHERPEQPEAPRPRQTQRSSHTHAPLPVPALPNPAARASGLCALGTQYGRWRIGSPEEKICGHTFGR